MTTHDDLEYPLAESEDEEKDSDEILEDSSDNDIDSDRELDPKIDKFCDSIEHWSRKRIAEGKRTSRDQVEAAITRRFEKFGTDLDAKEFEEIVAFERWKVLTSMETNGLLRKPEGATRNALEEYHRRLADRNFIEAEPAIESEIDESENSTLEKIEQDTNTPVQDHEEDSPSEMDLHAIEHQEEDQFTVSKKDEEPVKGPMLEKGVEPPKKVEQVKDVPPASNEEVSLVGESSVKGMIVKKPTEMIEKIHSKFDKWMKEKGSTVLAKNPEQLFGRFIASQDKKARSLLVHKYREDGFSVAEEFFPTVSQVFTFKVPEQLFAECADNHQRSLIEYAYTKAVSKRQKRVKVRPEEAHAVTEFSLNVQNEGCSYMDDLQKHFEGSDLVSIKTETRHGSFAFKQGRQGQVIVHHFIEFKDIELLPNEHPEDISID